MKFARAFISSSAYAAIQVETRNTKNMVETGGVLMGYYSRGTELVVTHASSPGPKAIQKKRSIEFDTVFCQSFADRIFKESQKCFTYIGDWHSHTEPRIRPSFADKWQMKKTLDKQAQNLTNPAMFIVYGDESKFDCSVYVYCDKKLTDINEFVILDYDI